MPIVDNNNLSAALDGAATGRETIRCVPSTQTQNASGSAVLLSLLRPLRARAMRVAVVLHRSTELAMRLHVHLKSASVVNLDVAGSDFRTFPLLGGRHSKSAELFSWHA